MVFRWLAAMIVAVSVAFAPVALDACQSTCASHDAAAHDGMQAHAAHHAMAAVAERSAHDHAHHAGHSCHQVDAAMPSDGPGIAGLPHTCGHTDEMPPTSLGGDQVVLHAPAVVPVLVSLTPRIVSTHAPSTSADVPDVVPLALSTPLRV